MNGCVGMKLLILIRHAKSSWSDPTLQDFDRPLNKRGRRNAPFMGEALCNKGVHFDHVYSSPAKRALDTANYICSAIGYDLGRIETDQTLYHASASSLLNFVRNMEDRFSTVAIVSHNPGLNELTNLLTEKHIDNIPTAGIVMLKASVDNWTKVEKKVVTLQDFDYPKRHLQNQKHVSVPTGIT